MRSCLISQIKRLSSRRPTNNSTSPRPNEERAGVRSSSFNYPFDLLFIWRHEPLTGHVFHHPHTASPALQRIPDGQQAALAVLSPLVVPETQRLNVLIRQKFFTHRIALQSFRQTMLETVHLHIQPRRRTIEIQDISPHPSFGHLLPRFRGRRLG